MPVVLLHDRWRREGWRAGAWIAPLWLGVALGAGESALAIAAYLFAYALASIVRRGDRARCRSCPTSPSSLCGASSITRSASAPRTRASISIPAPSRSRLRARCRRARSSCWPGSWRRRGATSPRCGRTCHRTPSATCSCSPAASSCCSWRSSCRCAGAIGWRASSPLGALGALVPVCSTFPADRLLWFVGSAPWAFVARWLELRPRAWWAAMVAALLS